jgi:hypothetical protein
MPVSVTCHSCGHTMQLPEEFQRRTVRCPECGVYCEVSIPSKPGAPKKTAKPISSPAVPAPDPPPSMHAPTEADPIPQLRQAPELPAALPTKKNAVIHCTFCGELVRWKAKKCPNCGTKVVRPPAVPKPVSVPQAKKAVRPPDPILTSDDSEDGLPYKFDTGPQQIRCPQCQGTLPADAMLCVHCGSHLETGERVKRVYEKIERQWESNMSLGRRKTIYIVSQAIVLPLMAVTAVLRGEPFSFIVPWLTGSILLAFLLGTYDRINLKRNRRGQVQLSKTWRVCFFERQTTKITPWEYEGIKIMRTHNFKVMDLLLLLSLGAMGIIPGILWWLWAMNKATYYVALTQHHGFPEVALYHGSSEEQMEDIAQTLIDATGLRCERS